MVCRLWSSTLALALSFFSSFPLAFGLALAARRCNGKFRREWPLLASSYVLAYLVQDIMVLAVVHVGLCNLIVLQALFLQDLLADVLIESCSLSEEHVHDFFAVVVLILLLVLLLLSMYYVALVSPP